MSPIAANADYEVYPILNDILQIDAQDGDLFTQQLPTCSAAPTGPSLDSTPLEEPPHGATTTPVPEVRTPPAIQRRKRHRAGRLVRARRLRAQLRLGAEFDSRRPPTPARRH